MSSLGSKSDNSFTGKIFNENTIGCLEEMV